MPSGLQNKIIIGQKAGGNARAISLFHATRVLVIVVILPLILSAVWGANQSHPPGAAIQKIALDQIFFVILGAPFMAKLLRPN